MFVFFLNCLILSGQLKDALLTVTDKPRQPEREREKKKLGSEPRSCFTAPAMLAYPLAYIISPAALWGGGGSVVVGGGSPPGRGGG